MKNPRKLIVVPLAPCGDTEEIDSYGEVRLPWSLQMRRCVSESGKHLVDFQTDIGFFLHVARVMGTDAIEDVAHRPLEFDIVGLLTLSVSKPGVLVALCGSCLADLRELAGTTQGEEESCLEYVSSLLLHNKAPTDDTEMEYSFEPALRSAAQTAIAEWLVDEQEEVCRIAGSLGGLMGSVMEHSDSESESGGEDSSGAGAAGAAASSSSAGASASSSSAAPPPPLPVLKPGDDSYDFTLYDQLVRRPVDTGRKLPIVVDADGDILGGIQTFG